jgi:hypothetical protein
MVPVSKDDFDLLKNAMVEKVQIFANSPLYTDFVEELIKDLLLDRKCQKY